MEIYQKGAILVLLLAINAAERCFTAKRMVVDAFSVFAVIPRKNAPTHQPKIRLYGMTPREKKNDGGGGGGDENNEKNNSNNASDDASFNVNEARSQLESLIDKNDDTSKKLRQEQSWTVASLLAAVSARNDNDNDKDDYDMVVTLPPPPPVLTAADRDRRLTEIHLLQRLDPSSSADDDDNDDENDDNVAVNLLWDLWYGERGIQAKRRLEETHQLMGISDAASLKKCEEILHEMIEQYGIYYYTEPLNRLATLYFLQGRHDESYKLCRIILQIKPWHFGALSGIVLVLWQQQQQQQLGSSNKQRKKNEAQKWAEQCLPPARVASISFPPFTERSSGDGKPAKNPRRKEWVTNAVKAAKEALQTAEQRAKESLGEPEEYYYYYSADESILESTEDDSADWQ
jgi:hypothetical protein